MSKRRQPRLAAILIAVALLLNAWIHVRLAGPFDANPGALLSQGALFRIQAVVNLVIAILIVVRPRAWAALLAFAVAAGGAAILTLTSVVPVDGSMLGLPYLFEPAWYPAKQTSLVLQLLAAVLAAGKMLHAVRRRRPVAV
ncbi:hypothetical protein ACFFGH_23750 [Lysobacter korlensis]|uniref:Integral membrane protein n=1 Tax=Lysobacter korlensis TaxID=553636 RepID=A0ABV6RV48_9GAMM